MPRLCTTRLIEPLPEGNGQRKDATHRHHHVEREAMAGTFEIFKDAKGEFRFALKSRNGEIVATGESYKTKAGAI
jgi:hypothetical protein